MISNTLKDEIKTALENFGYRSNGSNIELVYQTYLGGRFSSIRSAIMELRNMLKR